MRRRMAPAVKLSKTGGAGDTLGVEGGEGEVERVTMFLTAVAVKPVMCPTRSYGLSGEYRIILFNK